MAATAIFPPKGAQKIEIGSAITLIPYQQLNQLPIDRGGELAQWLAPRICSANRVVGGSNLTVSTGDPLG